MAREQEKALSILMAQRITALRKKAGYTNQEVFAYDAEIPRALYGKYEKGRSMTIQSLYRVIKFHKITFAEFFAEGFEKY